jgi:(R,R)-butanediol dehydrogenase / meso-butanediol dehydrogenase / diacetyl reductase
MRAAVLRAEGALEVVERPIPQPGADEVLVAVAYCGICGTDLHAYSELLVPVGSVLGHEFSGVVTEVGDEVRSTRVGDRVVIRPSHICGECEHCKAGAFRLCPQHFKQTIGVGAPGAFADAVVVKEYMAIPLPDSVPFEAAAWIEPLACGVHAVRHGGVGLGDHVAVYGTGPIGLMVLVAARLAGATELVAFEKSEVRRATAAGLGVAVHTLEDLAAGAVPDWLCERGADISFECAGVQATVDAAVANTRPGGTVVFEALYGFIPAVDLASAVPKELALLCSLGSAAREFQAAVDLMASGVVDVGPLTSAVVGLEQADGAFRGLVTGGEAVKVLVTPGAQLDEEARA